jgi:ATP-dependent Clp protease protease subunit
MSALTGSQTSFSIVAASSSVTTQKLKPRMTTTTKRGQQIAVKSNADELYFPPGGSIVDASGYEMFSSATSLNGGGIRSETTRAGMVVPRSEAGDPFQMLLRQRIVMLGNQVDDFVADAIISQLLLLNQQDPKKEIKLFINSPGGSVTAGMGIYDAMQFVSAPVGTVCMGLAASMGAFLLTAGEKGKRLSMPNARIMIHQPLGGASGQAVDIEIQAKEMMFHKGRLNQLMAFHSGQPVEKIDADTDRDRYMSPLEAKNYGLIDEVIGGDDAGLKIEGEMADFKKTKAEYVSWGNK